MGLRGPQPGSRKLKLAGTAPAGTAAVQVEPVAPEKPAAVAADRVLSALWDEIVPGLDKDGLLARSDGMALELCLRHFALARHAAGEADRDGITAADTVHGGTKKSPAEMIFRAESGMFLRYAQQLGLTFAGRARTPAAFAAETDRDNPFMPG